MRGEIQLLKQVIEAVVHKIFVDEVEIIGQTAKIYTCNTLYLNTGKLITIEDIEYRVDSFIINEYIIVSPRTAGDDLPPTDLEDFTIPNPRYYDGTPKRAQIENLNDKETAGYQGPIIWFLMWVEIAPPDDVRFSKVRSTIQGANIFYLDDCNEQDWNQEDHQTEVWGPQENEMWHIHNALKARSDIFDRDINDPARRYHSNFGTYLTNKGYEKTILTGAWSGVQAIVDIPYIIDPCECESVQVCRPVRFLIESVTQQEINAGGDLNLTIEDQDGNTPDYSYDVNSATLTVQTGGGSQIYNVISGGVAQGTITFDGTNKEIDVY